MYVYLNAATENYVQTRKMKLLRQRSINAQSILKHTYTHIYICMCIQFGVALKCIWAGDHMHICVCMCVCEARANEVK